MFGTYLFREPSSLFFVIDQLAMKFELSVICSL